MGHGPGTRDRGPGPGLGQPSESREEFVGSGHHSPRSLRSRANSGGAGICTRVRKYIPAGIYDAYPLLKSRSRRREAAKNRRKPAPESLVTGVRDNAPATSLLK